MIFRARVTDRGTEDSSLVSATNSLHLTAQRSHFELWLRIMTDDTRLVGYAGAGTPAYRGSSGLDAVTRGSQQAMLSALQQYGPAQGAQKLMNAEKRAAESAMETGEYVVWRSPKGNDCTRVGPKSMCFCGHTYGEHQILFRKNSYKCTGGCKCQR